MAQLTGQGLIELQSIQLNTSAFGGYGGIGTLIVRTDGLAFHKAKGALMGQALFGILGAAATKNRISAEPDREFPKDQIVSAEATGGLGALLKITLKDGTVLRFSSRTRVITGKNDLKRAADEINGLIAHA